MGVTTTLAIVAAAATAAGQIDQGNAAKRQADFQARTAEQQAASERQIAASTELDYRKAQSSRLAEIRAAMGGSGTDTSTGTPLLAMSDYAGETELNALRIRSGGEVQSRRLDEQAGFLRTAGSNAQQGGYARAGASLLSAGASRFK